MSCQRLSTVQGLAPEKLIKLAFKFLPFRTLQVVFATLHPTQHRILMQQQRRGVSLHHLANTLYYHQGATLSRLSRWNEMSKLQMQHELFKREQLDEREEKSLSKWGLRIKLVCVMAGERKTREEGKEQRRLKEEEIRRAWIAQCRVYEEEDEGRGLESDNAQRREQGGRYGVKPCRVPNRIHRGPEYRDGSRSMRERRDDQETGTWDRGQNFEVGLPLLEFVLVIAGGLSVFIKMFTSLIAEIKGVKPSIKKSTAQVKSATARKRADAETTSTSTPPLRQRAIARHPQQRQAIDIYRLVAQKPGRKPKRLAKSSYKVLKQQELLDEARVRGLEIDDEDKTHLVNILIIDDKAYAKLMELKRKRGEAEASQQHILLEVNRNKNRDARVEAQRLVWEKKQAENKAARAKEQEQRKRKRSNNSGSGYSSLPKRFESNRAPPVPPGSRKTGADKIPSGDRKSVKMSAADDMEDTHDVDEDEDGLGDFIVDDMPQKPKRKSDVGGMARSRLIAGL
ncbi:hypothetical protein BKA58DRAFT_449324 [Alternaria rosae]|uniref:uncharacterized protein n=1 Tax=Alternaria rosae TaxID=1187941 RepID=UPI001E8DB7E1|nr:uncharacterized protein BKA58DRAFT_449324 [Alternaria rosae]KAH6858966.1 hypothetical protein BKA58DRAFT_449324 [Alternaria rosae]